MDDAIVDAIYAAVTQEEMLGVVLESLARRFGCRAATLALDYFTCFDRKNRGVSLVGRLLQRLAVLQEILEEQIQLLVRFRSR